MSTVNHIKHFTHREIDLEKWDNCIRSSGNGVIYALSFFLNIMSEGWEALVLNDYEAVMPLTCKRKYGIFYLYQPYFIHSLGIFGLKERDRIVDDFLSAVPGKFRYWDIKLNETNYLTAKEFNPRINITEGTNYLLNLDKSYEQLNENYKRLCSRMIKKAIGQQVQIVKGVTPAEVIRFYKGSYNARHEGISDDVYNGLIRVTDECLSKGLAGTYIARMPNGEIVGAYLVLADEKFVYSLIGGSSEKGKQAGSFYLLTDAVIRDHAGTKKIFRFEGSNIPGIAFFNSQFGASPVSYQRLTRNTLPFPLNLFKK